MKGKSFSMRDIPMRTESNSEIDDVPVVARCPSFQQPYEEAMEMTREALKVREQ